jgi:hypothetical protein
MRYRLRTLLILMALLPPILAWLAWPAIRAMLGPKQRDDITVEFVWTVRTENLAEWWLELREPPTDQTVSPDEN